MLFNILVIVSTPYTVNTWMNLPTDKTISLFLFIARDFPIALPDTVSPAIIALAITDINRGIMSQTL